MHLENERKQRRAAPGKAETTIAGDDGVDDDPPRMITITIHKIGLKDVDRYVDPQVVVSVVDKDLVIVEEKQEISIASERAAPYIVFDSSVILRTHLHVLRQSTACF